MHPGRRLRALLALLLAGLVLSLGAACSKVDAPGARPDAEGRVQVYVTAKVMPAGMLVATARQTNVVELRALPADVAGADGVFDLNGLECLVAGQSLPAGTVVRRNQLVTPQEVGLDRGLTGGTGARPAGC